MAESREKGCHAVKFENFEVVYCRVEERRAGKMMEKVENRER
jgi:hypothetical protein